MADQHQYDPNLKLLAQQLTKDLVNSIDFSQKEAVKKMTDAEESFRKAIIRSSQAHTIYSQFIVDIAVHRRNRLAAKPYFREKAPVFSKKITPAIKNGDVKALQQFHINYNLISYIKKNWKGNLPKIAQSYYNKIVYYRNEIIKHNIPLAINRAKIFYKKVPKSYLTLMDMVSIANMGLVSGVDKFVGDWSKVFNGVCIGRMVGNLIAGYSDTMLYLYPSDRALLYRANALRNRLKLETMEDLTKAINESYVEDRKNGIKTPFKKVTVAAVSHVLQAASPISTHQTKTNEEGDTVDVNISAYCSDEDVEKNALDKDLREKTATALKQVDIIHQKVIKLRGVSL